MLGDTLLLMGNSLLVGDSTASGATCGIGLTSILIVSKQMMCGNQAWTFSSLAFRQTFPTATAIDRTFCSSARKAQCGIQQASLHTCSATTQRACLKPWSLRSENTGFRYTGIA